MWLTLNKFSLFAFGVFSIPAKPLLALYESQIPRVRAKIGTQVVSIASISSVVNVNFFPASSNFSFFLNALGVPYLKIKNPSHSVQWRQTCAIQDYIYIYIHVQSSLNRIAEILESRKAIDHRIHISLGSSIHISYHNNSAPKVIDNLNQNHHK